MYICLVVYIEVCIECIGIGDYWWYSTIPYLYLRMLKKGQLMTTVPPQNSEPTTLEYHTDTHCTISTPPPPLRITHRHA